MEWVEVTLEAISANMPTDVKAQYANWLGNYPDRSGRLQELMLNTIREFRDAIASHPQNVMDGRETWLPRSCMRHVEAIVYFSLCMDMGTVIDTSGNQAKVSADVFLRSIPFGRYLVTTGEEGDLPTPHYSVPERSDFGNRALPAFAAVILWLGAVVSEAAWIRPGSTVLDTDVLTTYSPSNYTPYLNTLFGHLQGIDGKLANAQNSVTNWGAYSRSSYDDLVIAGPAPAPYTNWSGRIGFATGNGTWWVWLRAELPGLILQYPQEMGGNYIIYWNGANDGPESGLDADYLDGESGEFYYPANNPSNFVTSGEATNYLSRAGGPSSAMSGFLDLNDNALIDALNVQLSGSGGGFIMFPDNNGHTNYGAIGNATMTTSNDLPAWKKADGTVLPIYTPATFTPASYLLIADFQQSQAMTNTILRRPGASTYTHLVLEDEATGAVTTQKILSVIAK